jgi:type II secretory pathway component PulM
LNALTTDNSPPTRTIRFIGNILSPAIKLWLRSQVQQVSDLEVQIAGTNRQIVTGNIPQVSILARDAVYQGLHVAKIDLVATDIQINLGQVVKGQPLKLLQKVPVTGKLQLQQTDIDASLRSPLLSNALTDLLFCHFIIAPTTNLRYDVNFAATDNLT